MISIMRQFEKQKKLLSTNFLKHFQWKGPCPLCTSNCILIPEAGELQVHNSCRSNENNCTPFTPYCFRCSMIKHCPLSLSKSNQRPLLWIVPYVTSITQTQWIEIVLLRMCNCPGSPEQNLLFSCQVGLFTEIGPMSCFISRHVSIVCVS